MSVVLSKKELIKLLKRDSTRIVQTNVKVTDDGGLSKFGLYSAGSDDVKLRIDIVIDESDKE